MSAGSIKNAIRLRDMDMGDLPVFREWLRAPHVAPWFQDPLDWIAEVEGQHGEFAWIHHFIVEYELAPIGFCQYYAVADSGETYAGFPDLRGVYSIDYIVGDAAYLRKGIGKRIVAALVDRIMQHEDARYIVVRPEPGNAASRGLLASCGFTLTDSGVYALTLRGRME